MARVGPGSYKRSSTWARVNSVYTPTIWIDGDSMYATCDWLKSKVFSDTNHANRMTFENRLWRALKDDWGVLAQTLTLDYQKGRVKINFDDDEEFIMAKISKSGL